MNQASRPFVYGDLGMRYSRRSLARLSQTYAAGAGNEGPGIVYARLYKIYAVVVTRIDTEDPMSCP